MRILLIHNYYEYRGGEETYLASLVRLLKKNGHKVTLYTKDSRKIEGLVEKFFAAIGLFWSFRTEKELSSLIESFRPDIAHFQNIFPLIGLTGYRICARYQVPIIQTIHNYRFLCPNPFMFKRGKIHDACIRGSFFRHIWSGCYHNSRIASFFFVLSFQLHKLLGTLNLIDSFIFPSPFTKDYYLQNIGNLKHKFAVIPYFWEKGAGKVNGVGKKDNYFLYVGRLSEEKGIATVLDAFSGLPSIALKVVGDGPLKPAMKRYERFSNIEFKGKASHRQTLHYMRHATCLVIGSLWFEVLPFVFIESVMQNTPVLTPDGPNFKTFNLDRRLFYRQGRADDLKRKVREIFREKTALSEESFHIYRNRYLPLHHYQQLMEIYSQKSKVRKKI